MNIVTILNKLKEKQFVPDTQEGIDLFSDCFNKFGISLLLLKDENKFDSILSLLEKNNIPLQKENGMFAFRIFAVDVNELEDIIYEYSAIDELDFLRKYPEIIAEAQTVHNIAKNIKKYQDENVSYKNDNEYDIIKILNYEDEGGEE